MTQHLEPALAQSTRTLTAKERDIYDDLGYVIVPDVLPTDELEAIDHEVDNLVSQTQAERRHRRDARSGDRDETNTLLQLGLRSQVCQRMAQDTRVLTLIEDIVTPGIAIYSVKLIAKPPMTDIPCHWHQDDAYYVKNSISRTRMSVWIPLQDAHERNGCLRVVPRSHRWGLQEHNRKSYGQCSYSMDDEEIATTLHNQAIPVPVPQGAVVLFSARLWHGSRGNETGLARRAFITSYQEATALHGNGAQWKILRPAPAESLDRT